MFPRLIELAGSEPECTVLGSWTSTTNRLEVSLSVGDTAACLNTKLLFVFPCVSLWSDFQSTQMY